MHNSGPHCGLNPAPQLLQSHFKTACSKTAKTPKCYWYHRVPFWCEAAALRSRMCSRLSRVRKSLAYSNCFLSPPVCQCFCLERNAALQKHTFSKVRVRHGKESAELQKAQMFTHRCFLFLFLTLNPTTHTRKHQHMHLRTDRVFHRQIARIRDSSPCCHDNDYIYPKHRFLPHDLCGALRPILGESVFNIMHGNAMLEQHYVEPIDQVWHTGRRGWCALGEGLITIDSKIKGGEEETKSTDLCQH